ncbi:PIN domain-like protein [Mollisia scopiformis]|uniref:PIN domain-like protein n=1 Tax=Mollisia scopiformis TaxID=149040 RepID=A0A194XGP0_MOLSC|nr:PIN domain-like protein [Mollisia scopiformis]KUJ18937.1 PIN domain-like protein [Mollisia scopiformis]
MGVTGLWPILAPSARPTPLPTLNRKRLAVDASIWIYQFLKAVRDKEGNALRNSHIVGFFRRICKLLYFGIKPVFVFDGGAPALKRQTVLGRKRRREGRREDAVRTAGKLLAVQMKRRGEEEEEKRKQDRERARDGLPSIEDEEEAIPEDLVYVGEMGMSAAERQQTRKFKKTDQYHLPDLTNGIEGMGQPNDPRIMSAEELEEYARQFHDGEDVNLYDFSKIDFNGEFFLSLPPGDRYNILNAARLRSRLRMGLSKEQLEEMFPDRMEFSKFQIARVKERNELTQRLMNLNGMNDMAGVGGGRIAGERGREYVLVKNDGVEGGWALGVVSTDKTVGQREKPIDVDALHPTVQNLVSDEDEDDFEDVPIEGLNRLPKAKTYPRAQEFDEERQKFYESRNGRQTREVFEDPVSLFVDDNPMEESSNGNGYTFDEEDEELNRAIAMSLQQEDVDVGSHVDEEQDHINQAIALSLQKNHRQEESDEEEEFEDIMMPEYQQKAVQEPKPITSSGGRMVAHIVNNRANAAVPKRKAVDISSDSDEEMDLQAALAKARRQKAPDSRPKKPAPVVSNLKNPFDGPLPFEKLDFKTSIFGKKNQMSDAVAEGGEGEEEDGMAGGFDNDLEDDAPRPLPPWLASGGDIRSQVEIQKKRDQELNAEDREVAEEEERQFRRQNAPIQIDSSDEESDVEVVDKPPTPKAKPNLESETFGEVAENIRAEPPVSEIPQNRQPSVEQENEPAQDSEAEEIDWSESNYGDATTKSAKVIDTMTSSGDRTDIVASKSTSPEPDFEDVELPVDDSEVRQASSTNTAARKSPSPTFEDFNMPDSTAAFPSDHAAASGVPGLPTDESLERQRAEEDAEFDLSDPDDEEMLAQMALETEEHARFESTLNHKSERENQEAYERDIKALRNQQKKDRRDADEVTNQMITECQMLLRLFGLPYVTAPMEAEAQCAELVSLGLVDGVVTDDCDIFLFGGTRVYKNLFNSNKLVECYLSNDIEKELSLNRDQLIAFAHLLGSDYTEGLAGIGPVTAVEILSEFPSTKGLEEFKEWWLSAQHSSKPLNTEPSTFRKKFRRSQATKLFLPPGFPSPAVTEAYLKPDVDANPEPFQWGVPDLDRLRDFLMATIGWTQERTDEVLVPVIRDMNRREQEGTQSNITRFFEGAVGAGAGGVVGKERAVGSKRMKDAVNKLKAKKSAREGSVLTRTYSDEAREWAAKNDIGWTEKEQAKHARKSGKRKEKKKKDVTAAVERILAAGESDGEDESTSGDEYRKEGIRSNGKGKGKAARKRAKV